MDLISKPIELGAFLFLLLLLLCTQPLALQPQRADSSTGFRCIEEERDALLDFKSGLDDPGNRLSSWVKEDDDCCQWRGVRCNNRTGRVERLLLRAPLHPFGRGWETIKMLGGEIRPSLLNLTHMKHLDLSLNNFSAMIGIPVFLGSFKELRYLNLSNARFNGRVPPELGNLSTLQHLDLSWGGYDFIFGVYNNLEVEDTRWLSRLTSLRHLDMSEVMFQEESSSHNWLHALNMLPSILEIRLSNCDLGGRLPSSLPHHNNFTSLSILDLSSNYFNSTIPEWLCNLTSLSYLDLSWNQFSGQIPAALGNLTSLEILANLCNLSTFRLSGLGVSGFLDELQEIFTGCMSNNLETLELSSTNLTGHMPDWLGGLVSLQSLTLHNSKLTGHIPKTLGRLSNLTHLDLGWNNLEGNLTEEHFMSLTRLKSIYISGNPSLALKVSSGWNPPFRLDHIYMSSCLVGPQFPSWLRTQENYTRLDMSNAGISDTIPDWFWNLSTRFEYLFLSHNKIGGKLQSLTSNQVFSLDLSFNLFSGPIPPSMWDAMPNLEILSLSTNRINGPIPPSMWDAMPNLESLSLSTNRINGTIPLSICKATYLYSLDLSNNFLSGELPKCWEKQMLLVALNLSSNNLSGGLPSSICMPMYLTSLHLGSNILSGELLSLSNCTALVELDLSGNRFNGSIPPWMGQNLSYLKILSLHSNRLSGNIPSHLSNLSELQILDLSHNQLSGFIPESFGNFTAMKFKHNISDSFISNSFIYISSTGSSMMLSMKGRELQYDMRLLSIVVTIDLSYNQLHGSVPKQVGDLIGLVSLNLSGNQLSGEIIKELGKLQQLETLDLSKNNFSGRIPSSLSNIHFLSNFNLSYNNLTGKIPSGDQLQTFGPSSYIGNDDLCGPPLIKKCPEDETPPTIFTTEEETEESDDIVWIYSGMAPGYVVGLLAFFGLLALKRKWRIAYIRFIDNIYDTIYVAIAINIKKLKRGMPKIGNRGLARRN